MTEPGGPEAPVDAVACGPVWVSSEEMCEVRVRGRPVPMSLPRQRILARLLVANGRIVTRDELYELASQEPLPAGSRAVDVQVARIRRSLGGLGRHLMAVPGRGYRIDVVGLSRAR